MKTLSIIFFFISIVSLNSNAQIKFENGYFITKQGEKVNCLIKDKDWSYNPTRFNYKLNDSSEIKIADTSTVAEFGIENFFKYKRFTVNIDRSSEILAYMTDYYEPRFNKEQLFLKVLIEGKATLYEYESANLTRFFFSNDSLSNPEQLVYKTYYTSNNTTGENDTYKQQLLKNLKSLQVSEKDIEYSHYTKNDLLKIFNKNNGDQLSNIVYAQKKIKRDIFDISIRPGVDFSTLNLRNQDLGGINIGSQTNFRLGLEGEYIFPFNRNKWSVIFEPSFHQYNKTVLFDNSIASMAYKGIEFPVGIRYYIFVNDRSKFFINAALGYSVYLNSNTQVGDDSLVINGKSNFNVICGLGYKYNNRLSIEARYDGGSDLLTRDNYWYPQYNTFSIIAGYTIFKKL
jgi:hypothetical protein